ncbi:2-dehydro-3-deoxy-6-phosphogalactonate aldolase [Halomonas sp. NO4]|uniref:2-dehydro-3-deoxy-6-phosphogalactonate aldolase n=1 Tax=Halomonas sp. NO4 TaxID=2484813 RepID=UPI0013D88EAE|nr:2-dehydro-3-deoxy-6-phosphogalactonate aldolase [Halomonas sp. NO4]
MSVNMQAFEQAMEACPLVAILRGVQPDEVIGVAETLMECGIRLIEVPLNSPEPWESIARLKAHCPPEVLVGAGTVLTSEEVRRLAGLETPLLVTPNSDPAVIREARGAGLVALIGCMTPTEALAAARAGATALKLFPAGRLGVDYFRDMRAVLPPELPVLAVGGIDIDDLAAWHAAGIAGVGLGSSLYAPGRSLPEIEARALALVAEWRRLQSMELI